ncbi:UNVERIFIED_CONTAM: hypothetical protein Slati_2305500 [Sesamum latifolium]|uniref:Neprosin PEP catalytic domain-containing protein n=1 Tax=Sesamum latifolium TaxID=2727402 RepID=A0AAW2WDF6_9LAMI
MGTVYGDVYDCIDVYKQHSLTHPAHRDHKIKMKPSREILAAFPSQRNESKISFVNKLWKSKKGCPKGTVPIRRTTTNDHMNLANNSWDHSLSHSDNGVDEAGVGWWLGVGPARKFIGYWPVKLFNSIQDHADSLRLGGQVFTPPSDDVRPQMGSGKFVNGQYDKTCYMRRVGIIDDTRVKAITDIDNSYVSGTDSRCFYEGDNSFKNEINRYSFVFGGGGGKDEHGCEF